MNTELKANVANSNAEILVDEVGIETAIYRSFRIKVAYRPIYRRRDDMQIEATAVEAVGCPYLKGRPVDLDLFMSALGLDDRDEVNGLVRTLSLRNLKNVGAEDVSLFIDVDLAAFAEGADATPVDGDAVDAGRLVCSISSASLLDRHDLVEHSLTLRADGCGIAISGFGSGPWDIACLQAVRPDIVRLDTTWFRRAASNRDASRLLVPLVAGLRDQGADILVAGISSAAEFKAALDCGADLFEGDFFGRPALAGTVLDTARIPVAPLLGQSNVVQLFA